MPVNMIARKMGYRELVDYDMAGVVYSYNTVTTLKHTPGKSHEVTEKLSRTMTGAIDFFKINKAKSLAVMKKYMRGASDAWRRLMNIANPGWKRCPRGRWK
jgi:hypothetical protein